MKQARLLTMFILAGTVAAQAAEPLATDLAASPFENRENAAAKKEGEGEERSQGESEGRGAIPGVDERIAETEEWLHWSTA